MANDWLTDRSKERIRFGAYRPAQPGRVSRADYAAAG